MTRKTHCAAWFKEIAIEESLGYINEDGASMKKLSGLSAVNVFVGQTSSGKTRMMRAICKMSDPSVRWGGEVSDVWGRKIDDLCKSYNDVVGIGVFDQETIQTFSNLPGASFVENFNQVVKTLTELQPASHHSSSAYILGNDQLNPYNIRVTNLESSIEQLEAKLLRNDTEMPKQISRIREFLIAFRSLQKKFQEEVVMRESYTGFNSGTNKGERFFVVSTRVNLPSLYSENRDNEGLLEQAFRKQYFTELDDSNFKLWTGERTLSELKYMKGRERLGEFEEYLRTEVFHSSSLKLNVDGDKLEVSIDGGPSRCVSEHGDGVMNLITLTIPFYTEQPRMLFFDEPEHGLHPGHLRAFVNALIRHRSGSDNKGKAERSVVVFVTTHSGELLDMLNTIEHKSFFKFKKTSDHKLQINRIEWGNCQLINELGIRPGASMLVNCTVWVEGVTDRLFLGHLVRLAIKDDSESKKLQEGVHYAFMEYGGANLPHWSFIDRKEAQIDIKTLCGNGILVMDRDSSGWKKDRLNQYKVVLKDRLVPTCGRELENMISAKMLDEFAFSKGYKGKVRSNRKDFRNKKIGEYVAGTYKLAKVKDKYGSLVTKHKNKIAEEVQKVESLSGFPKEVQNLAKKLLEFIKENN